jgi:hypothetical protein
MGEQAHPEVVGGTGVDGVVERLGRWAARRTTRRSFLGRVGRLGVLVAGGTTMATLLADQAEARVCGQSGTAPRCATFDCNATWGWCWYASGCCAGGALKKICDCCAPNTPHPVGYCPSGTRVLCIVESCGADPRLQTRAVRRLGTGDPVALAVAISRERFPRGAPIAVLGDAGDAGAAALTASLGGLVAGPTLLTRRTGLDAAVAEELGRLRVEFLKVVGPALGAGIDAALAQRGIVVERVGRSSDLSTLSAEVAEWSRPSSGKRRAIVVMPSAIGALASAAAAANALNLPLLVGDTSAVRRALASPRDIRTTFVLTGDAADGERFRGAQVVAAGDPSALSRGMGDLLVGLRGGRVGPTSLVARGDGLAGAALAAVPGALLLHSPGSLDGARSWFLARRLQISDVTVAGDRRAFPDQALYDLQSAINEYETQLLRGGAGEGLPVIPQPQAERPIGRARP